VPSKANLLRAILNHVQDAIVVTSARGAVLLANPPACKLFGYALSELKKLSVDLLFHPDETRGFGYDAEFGPAERRLARSDGSMVRVEATGGPVDDEVYVHVFREMPDRPPAGPDKKRELLSQIDELRVLLEVAPFGIAIAHDAACASIAINPACAEMLGIPVEANASKSAPGGDELPFVFWRHGRELSPDEHPMEVAASTGAPVPGQEIEIVRDDGSRMLVLHEATPLFTETGEVRGCLGMFVDITQRKRAEHGARSEQREALVLERRHVDEFIEALSREIHDAIKPMGDAADVIEAIDQGSPILLRTRETIRERALAISRRMDDMHEASRLGLGLVRLETERLDIVALVCSVLDEQKSALQAGGRTLDIELDATPVWVGGDKARLARVIRALLENAVRFTEPGAKIDVVVGSKLDRAVVEVRDTGVGMDAAALARVFRTPGPGRPMAERCVSGPGLGLILVARLVALHGGEVRASSEGAGHGSTFEVILPLWSAAAARPSRPKPPALPDRRRPRHAR
jgi:PAS domain S-box-containing protein